MESQRLPVSLVITSPSAAGPSAAAPRRGTEWFRSWVDPTGRECGYACEGKDGVLIRLFGVGHFTFTRSSGHVRGVPEPSVSYERFRDAFHRLVLPRFLQHHNWEVLHASGLVVDGTCAALCGPSGMGKSTLARAWHCQGGAVLADDTIIFRVEAGAVAIRPIPFRIRLDPPARVGSCRVTSGEASGNLSLAHSPLGRASRGARPGLVVYLLDRRPDANNGAIQVERMPPAQALPLLLKQAYFLTLSDRARNRAMIETYMDLVRVVPVFGLSYPTDMGQIHKTLTALVTHLRSQVGARTQGAESRRGRER